MPRAVGTRMPYAATPDGLRAWVEATLGSPVVEASDQVGGMAPGCATRLRCADGTCAFVKAVGAELNPDTPSMYRHEVEVLDALGSDPLWATLIGSYDDGAWVGLLLEDVAGGNPDLTDDRQLSRLLADTDRLVARLSAVDVPAGMGSVIDTLRNWSTSLDHLDELPPGDVPDWIGDIDLRERVAGLLAEPDSQWVHFDIRDDNLLLRDTGELVFVDWGGALRGPSWVDPMLARWERIEDPWFDDSLAGSAYLRGREDLVTTFLVVFGIWLRYRNQTATDLNLTGIRAFRERESRRMLGAAARRLGV